MVYLSTYKSQVDEAGSGFLHPSQVYTQRVELAKDDGVWKIDAIDLGSGDTINPE